ncbi:hypothetical protein SCHPADRAFT_905765 [Schizopora paradoxa]|uniref:Uncharacterized protein n=1 Tax=Schizopora paradoxa TaxID=27342 RepID=A0A0H2RQI9_9AGAM|nr:hypothetical protein SCHPADRAFT_905765 [Schizopora paradoxa]
MTTMFTQGNTKLAIVFAAILAFSADAEANSCFIEPWLCSPTQPRSSGKRVGVAVALAFAALLCLVTFALVLVRRKRVQRLYRRYNNLHPPFGHRLQPYRDGGPYSLLPEGPAAANAITGAASEHDVHDLQVPGNVYHGSKV